ncbi:MAG: hypothetical protein AAGB19_19320 [Cyanobacteria bacterium P01_F01_bin.3]
MAIRVKTKALGRLLCLAGVLTVVGSVASAAHAQEPESVLDAVENITERRSGDYFQNRSFGGQVGFMTGLGGFSEQRLTRDAAAFSGAVEELWVLQTQNTATVRVPDLPNPYTTSVQLLPASQFDSRVVGSELNFEPLPRR